jgi:hypothetical protein
LSVAWPLAGAHRHLCLYASTHLVRNEEGAVSCTFFKESASLIHSKRRR